MAAREDAHRRELEIGRRQQQIQFDRQQIEDLGRRGEELHAELGDLTGRREPLQTAITTQADAAAQAHGALEAAAHRVTACDAEYATAQSGVQDAERDADETRAVVLSSGTTLAALRQARDNAAAVRDRVAAERSRLEIEARDLQQEVARAERDRETARTALEEAREALARTRTQRAALDAELTGHRRTRDRQAEELAARQHLLTSQQARLRSLEQLEAQRASFGDAARFLLETASPDVQPLGAVADYLDVERSYERAVDALLGDLLQHVIVEREDQVLAALVQLAGANAGRCGFVVLEDARRAAAVGAPLMTDGARALRDVIRVNEALAPALLPLIGDALIVDAYETASRLSRLQTAPVATLTGEVFRAAARVEGGSRADARGILEMRGDISRLREETAALNVDVHRIANELFGVDLVINQADLDVAACLDAEHQYEKSIVGLEGQLAHFGEEAAKLGRRLDLVTTERRRADEEERAADARREEAAAAIDAHEREQLGAEGRLSEVLARLQAAREAADACLRQVTAARTEQATLAERTLGLDTELARLHETARDLETRVAGRQTEILRIDARRADLNDGIRDNERQLDDDVRAITAVQDQMRGLDEAFVELRGRFAAREHEIRAARHAADVVRADVTRFEVARATAAADLSHLAAACLEAVNLTIDEVVAEVARMEREGELTAPARRLAAIAAPDEDEAAEEAGTSAAAPDAAEQDAPDAAGQHLRTPEGVIADLRGKIDRLGPVNMMAIEQFDELETRHSFLTTQRQDLLDSISQTGEAIRKIDKTTRERFEEAFVSINANFEQTFTTLFGGGRAGLVLIDQENETESGIDIIAQPPGKRLQNVQLLSGGEKALTAMALMFAIFKYRPSPFCLLDEIDAPLDDANIGRFVEMLQGMQSHTQFILITHNRKTMEIANRLYGVTMEEPGVSKLISLQLN